MLRHIGGYQTLHLGEHVGSLLKHWGKYFDKIHEKSYKLGQKYPDKFTNHQLWGRGRGWYYLEEKVRKGFGYEGEKDEDDIKGWGRPLLWRGRG